MGLTCLIAQARIPYVTPVWLVLCSECRVCAVSTVRRSESGEAQSLEFWPWDIRCDRLDRLAVYVDNVKVHIYIIASMSNIIDVLDSSTLFYVLRRILIPFHLLTRREKKIWLDSVINHGVPLPKMGSATQPTKEC